MKKTVLIVFLVLILLLVGCGKPEATQEEADEDKAAKTTTETAEEDSSAAQIKEFESTILTKLKGGQNDFLIYPSQSTADENKEGFFVVGIRNNLPGTKNEYRITLKKSNAHTVGGLANPLPMDNTAVGWFKSSSDFGPWIMTNPGMGQFDIDKGIKIAIIYYNVGDMATATDNTEKGNYRFYAILEINKGDKSWDDWEPVGSQKAIAIKYV